MIATSRSIAWSLSKPNRILPQNDTLMEVHGLIIKGLSAAGTATVRKSRAWLVVLRPPLLQGLASAIFPASLYFC